MDILLVEDNPGDARLIEILLAEEAGGHFQITHVMRLADAIERVSQQHFDVVLLDLSLPDSFGLDTVSGLRCHAPNLPIVILSGLDNEEMALRALQSGAQDYLVKGQADGNLIKRAVLYAIERQRIRHQVLLADAAFDATETGIMVLDHDRRIMRVNPALTRLTGLSAEEMVGHAPSMLGAGESEADFLDHLWATFNPENGFEGEVWNRRRSGEQYPVWVRINAVRDDLGSLSGYVLVVSDITHRKQAEEELVRQATRDPLTGLANRNLFIRHLEETVDRAAHAGTSCGLLFVDLDGFKEVNDTLGHDAGDDVLKDVARRLRGTLRASDEVARLAGDEFVIILGEVQKFEDAEKVAAKVVEVLHQPYQVTGGAEVSGVSASVGVAVFPSDARASDSLIKAADAAMYRAKRQGKNCWRSFHGESQSERQKTGQTEIATES